MLIEHLPPFMRDFEEFKKLFDIEDSVLDELKTTYKRHEDNLWIQTADEYGIKRREKLIGIEKPEGDLEDRRKDFWVACTVHRQVKVDTLKCAR